VLVVLKCFIFSYTLHFLIFKYFLLILSSIFPPKSKVYVHFVERYFSFIFFGSNTTKKCQIQTKILMKKTMLVNYTNIYRWKILLIFPLIITNEKTSVGEYRKNYQWNSKNKKIGQVFSCWFYRQIWRFNIVNLSLLISVKGFVNNIKAKTSTSLFPFLISSSSFFFFSLCWKHEPPCW